MLRHGDIWRAIDLLAADHGLTPSGLARRAGLDPTTFNKSKRISREGKARWPSTESVAKILDATGSSLDAFTANIGGGKRGKRMQRVPVLGYAEAGNRGFFDDAGYPVGTGWDEIVFPDINDPHVFALEVSGNSMEPVYREGDVIVVSPAAQIRRGDRVVLKTREDEVMAKQLVRQTAHKIDLQSLNPRHPDRSFNVADVAWMARIVWASQ